MMKRLITSAIFTASVAVAAGSLVGTWRANPAKTKLTPGSPDTFRLREIMSIDDMGPNQYRVTRTTSDGKNSTVGLTFDGMLRSSDPETSAVGMRVGPGHFRNTIKGPKGTLVSDWKVAPDGKVLTNTRKGNGTSSGRVIDEVLVYERQQEKPESKILPTVKRGSVLHK